MHLFFYSALQPFSSLFQANPSSPSHRLLAGIDRSTGQREIISLADPATHLSGGAAAPTPPRQPRIQVPPRSKLLSVSPPQSKAACLSPPIQPPGKAGKGNGSRPRHASALRLGTGGHCNPLSACLLAMPARCFVCTSHAMVGESSNRAQVST